MPTHTHVYTTGRSGSVETCRCGKFRHVNVKPENAIVEQRAEPPTIFDTRHISVNVDRNSGDIHVACDMRGCNAAAEFQVRRNDVFDGFWQQACCAHLPFAVREVGMLPRNAQPHGPLQVRGLAVHVTTCPYADEPTMPPAYCCRNLESFS